MLFLAVFFLSIQVPISSPNLRGCVRVPLIGDFDFRRYVCRLSLLDVHFVPLPNVNAEREVSVATLHYWVDDDGNGDLKK